MRNFAFIMTRWILFFIVAGLVEVYAYQAIKTGFENKWVHRIYIIISIIALLFLVYSFSRFDRSSGQNQQTLITLGLMLLIYVPKLMLSLFLAIEDLFRLGIGAYQYFADTNSNSQFLPERRRFISQVSLAIAAIPFSSFLYGMVKGRYNYKVLKSTVYFNDLPDAFDGFKVLQLSDIHSGSFDNPDKIKYGIDLINEQDFDLLVFTGDMVNTLASEMDNWVDVFREIKTPEFGKFSVLGNHDYGDYAHWDTEEDRANNFEGIKAIHPKIGFELLLNENKRLERGNDSIHLVGVENWGKRFKKAGDLKKASTGLSPEDFKILLSHDPSHWDYEVRESPMNYHLTLSGHTHGMQFGIEIPGFLKWSPVQYVYRFWAGLYENSGRFLYVNRGFGYHAYPGRVGIWPEITLIELKKRVNS